MELDMVAIGKNIRKAREAKGLSQSQLERATNISRPTISLIERGKNLPMLYTVLCFAKALGISVDELLFGERRPDNG